MANHHNASSGQKSSPLIQYGLEDQLLYHRNGYVFNLSDIDWSFAKVYEYESSNSTHDEYDIVTTNRSVALSVFAVIFFVGLVGNALVIYTVGRYEAMRRGTYLYLLNLSVADMLYLLVCLPTLSISYALVDWRFGRVFCKLENYLMSVSMSVSVMTIMATGLDRYIAVIHPLRSRAFRTIKKTVTVITLTWILSLVIMAPRIAIFDETTVWHMVGLITLCSRVQTDQILQLDTSLNFVFMYLLPLLGLSACHSRIGQRLWTNRRPGIPAAQRGQIGTLLVRDRRRIAMIVFAITVVFAVGWLPIHVFHLVEDFDKGNILFGEIIDRGTIALFFSFGANALNPIFYCMFSSTFRQHFRKAFQCWGNKGNTSISPAVFRFLKVPTAQAEVTEYRQTPRVLLPRPASLLPSPVKLVENEHLSFSKSTRRALIPSVNIVLPVLYQTQAVSLDLPSSCSPHSTENVAPIEVIDTDSAPDSSNRDNQEDTPTLSPLTISVIQIGKVNRRRFQRQRSASLPSAILTRHSRRALIRSRSKSSGDLNCEKDELEALESLQHWFEISVHDLNISEDGNTCSKHTGEMVKHKQYGTTLLGHKPGTEFSCRSTFSLSRRRRYNTATNNDIYTCRNRRNPSLIQESSLSIESSDTRDLQETSLSVSISTLHKCGLISSVNVQTPSSGSGVAKTTEIKPTACSHFGSSHIHDFMEPACNTKTESYRASKKIVMTNNRNRSNNLPPVD